MTFHPKRILPHMSSHTATRHSCGRLRILDFEAVELARQLTLIDSHLFNQIKPVECMHEAWRHEEPWMAANIKEVLKVFQQIKYWVASSILGEKDLVKRAHIIETFINMASYCASWNNYNTCMGILEGLSLAPVISQQQTWQLINSKHKGSLENLRKLMSPCSNYRLYRANLVYLTTPCVPYLHVYLDDWENNSTDVDRIISEVERHQGSYRFSIVHELITPLMQELQEYGTCSAVMKIVKSMEDKYDEQCSFLDEENRYTLRLIQ